MTLEALFGTRTAPFPRVARPVSRFTDASGYLIGLAGALAVSGLAELFLQRIVYRIGVHIPRDGAVLEGYRVATFSGDFAFRLTAVLLAMTSIAALVWLARQRSYFSFGLLSALLTMNLLAWPAGLPAAGRLAPLVFAFGAAWLAGRTIGRPNAGAIGFAAVAAALTLALSQYQAGMTGLGDQPAHVAAIQLMSEVGLLATAGLVGVAAFRRPLPRPAVAVASLLTVMLVASYAREPATVAILSLWATGVTMSLPGMVYIAAFGMVVFAGLAWVRVPQNSAAGHRSGIAHGGGPAAAGVAPRNNCFSGTHASERRERRFRTGAGNGGQRCSLRISMDRGPQARQKARARGRAPRC